MVIHGELSNKNGDIIDWSCISKENKQDNLLSDAI